MAPVGASVLGKRGTTPTVPRVGRTGMEAPASRPGGSTRQSAPAVPWRDDELSNAGNEAAVPVVRPGTHHQGVG